MSWSRPCPDIFNGETEAPISSTAPVGSRAASGWVLNITEGDESDAEPPEEEPPCLARVPARVALIRVLRAFLALLLSDCWSSVRVLPLAGGKLSSSCCCCLNVGLCVLPLDPPYV